jgi:hypothetical protein
MSQYTQTPETRFEKIVKIFAIGLVFFLLFTRH